MKPLQINEDISLAATLPASFYRNPATFDLVKEKIFARSWIWVEDATVLNEDQNVYPFTFLEGVLNEPLVFTRDKSDQVHCLSNVCTHRGKVIIETPSKSRLLTCGYHGRCFDLEGQFKRMPEFKETKNFPTAADHLTAIPFKKWLGMLFVSLDPKVDLEEMVRPIMERLSFLPLDEMTFDASTSKDYYVDANWALYCDNYLEGFHIPFVHPALNDALEFENYDYEISPYCNLQLGIGKADEPCFDIPEGHPDFGQRVYAYYYWLFPNLMLNFYPWGLSLNIVLPTAHNKTGIKFRSYLFPNNTMSPNENRLDDTEMEDEAVVESVQLGIQSRYYQQGRFSPTMEKGVHHFHRLVAEFMNT